MDENLAYALAGYEAYLNGYIYDHEYNPVDKLLDCLEKETVYCLVSIDPFNKLQCSYHLEAVCDSYKEAEEKAVSIKIRTYVVPFTTRYYVIKEVSGLAANKDESPIPSKSEIWKETDYQKEYKWKRLKAERLYWEKQIYNCLPDHPLSRCGYKTYTEFIDKLKNDINKSKNTFNIGQWMADNGYATGPIPVYSDDKLSFLQTYELNQEALNGTGITMPNLPTDDTGLLYDAEAEHFLGLKDRGYILTNSTPFTKIKAKAMFLKNAKKKFDMSIFGGSQKPDSKPDNHNQHEVERKTPLNTPSRKRGQKF